MRQDGLQVSGTNNNNEYYTVKFNDKSNNKSKEIKIPIGSLIERTNDSFEIKSDGIYQDGKKINSNEIEMTLPQMTAISVFAGDDSTINDKDIKRLYNADVAKSINDGLAKSGSEYYVKSIADGDGAFSDAGVGNDGFSAIFRNEQDDFKQITIMTPSQREVVEKQEEEYQKRETELDKAYADKHWIRNMFGITRQEYEMENSRDY